MPVLWCLSLNIEPSRANNVSKSSSQHCSVRVSQADRHRALLVRIWPWTNLLPLLFFFNKSVLISKINAAAKTQHTSNADLTSKETGEFSLQDALHV